LEFAVFLQIFTLLCSFLKRQSSKILIARKLHADRKAAKQRNIIHKKMMFLPDNNDTLYQLLINIFIQLCYLTPGPGPDKQPFP